jgi:hypothetical protein
MSMQAANRCGGVLLMIGLAGCGGYETAYERAVYDAEPVYCYRTVADPDCYRVADPASNRRLVNYYGPSPRRTEAPRPAEIRLDPPPADTDAAAGGAGRAEAPAMGDGAQPPMPGPLAASADARAWEGRDPGTSAERPPTTRPTTRARRSGAGGASPGPPLSGSLRPQGSLERIGSGAAATSLTSAAQKR